jgi:hypothetical protein
MRRRNRHDLLGGAGLREIARDPDRLPARRLDIRDDRLGGIDAAVVVDGDMGVLRPSARATAAPMPVDAPVMRKTLSARSGMLGGVAKLPSVCTECVR